ncbi:MAG: energy-coupling factor transporter transmembrane protein EcfT [Syntrophomonadaceae bacterium]|nr:energy-coupling factor transporter transmembrane protein EcfT [Syntrophomonadaceae bacterium]
MPLEYKPKENLFYYSNPWVILALVFCWIFLALLFNHPLYVVSLFLIINITVLASGNFRGWLYQLKFALPFVILIMLINSLFNNSGATNLLAVNLLGFCSLTINLEGLVYGLVAGIKLMAIITGFSFYTLVIDSDQVLNLTRRLGYQISLIINMSMRLFPLVWQDYSRIREIQRYRSLPYENSTGLAKLKSQVPSLTILLVNSLNRSLQTAESLYSRGYGSGPSTVYSTYKWQLTDYVLLGNIFLMAAVALWSQFQPWSFYFYYPNLASIDMASVLTALFLSIILSLPLLLNWSFKLWQRLK